MRTLITAFCIVALLVSFIVGERICVADFCREFALDIQRLEKMVKRNELSGEFADKLVEKWEKQKNYTFVFANHNNFNDIETGIYNIEHSVKSKSKDDSLFFINGLYHKVNELYEGTRFTLGNLL